MQSYEKTGGLASEYHVHPAVRLGAVRLILATVGRRTAVRERENINQFSVRLR